MPKILLSLLVLAGSLATPAFAQELNCKVKVLSDRISGVDKAVFQNMERGISEFINTRKWTGAEVAVNERIDCTMLINVNSLVNNEQDGYKATINIQASRPVYNSSYTSPLVNFVDRDVTFRFPQFSNINFDDNRVAGSDALTANLPAVLAYYVYLIIGMDGDSFSPSGGDAAFKRALNVVQNAPESGGIAGWKAFENKTNRYWIVDQLLSPRFASLRSYWYNYHRNALDNMFNKPQESRTIILGGIDNLGKLYRENPAAGLLQFFFSAKSDELLKMVAQLPKAERTNYATTLSQSDLANAQKYNLLK